MAPFFWIISAAMLSGSLRTAHAAHTTNPDTAAAFLRDTYYSGLAKSAKTPNGYSPVFINTHASPNAAEYLGFTTLATYDVQMCADACTSTSGCRSFNIYFERDPSVDPIRTNSNPASTTKIKCAWWKSEITKALNSNNGQWRDGFQVVLAGSNGYKIATESPSPSPGPSPTPAAGEYTRTTPIMGYNSYNDVSCNPNQSHMEETMTALHDQGFIDLGYSMFQIDCGWQGRERQKNGSITYDATAFPDGMSYLSQKAISLGFQWGMYTDEGVYSCDTNTPLRVGSKGYEEQDALQFAGWNVVYMKVDNCYVDGADSNSPKDPDPTLVTRYTNMWNALNAVGIDHMLVCEWGVPWPGPNGTLEGPAEWTPPISTSFRIADDISPGWFDVYRIMNQAVHVNVLGQSGKGHYADMDLLEVGNNFMSADQEATHFAIWAMFKSTLIISTNVGSLQVTAAATLKNKDLIAINQDAAMEPVVLVQRYPDHDLFAGPLANGDRAVLLIDQSGDDNTLSVDFSKLHIASATVKNLWTGETTSGATSYTGTVTSHGSLPLRLSEIQQVPSSTPPSVNWIQATSGVVSRGAITQSCSGCSNGQNVGYITSDGGTLTLSGISTSQETQDVLIDYVNADVAYGFQDQNPNARGASIAVNGGAPVNISFPLSGYNWDRDVFKNFKVQLSGFRTGADNTITITGDGAVGYYGPNLDRIGVVA